ncbi:hypothetical protein [Nostoc sp.]|uniref:hypothetical protein n=1 Tax=Nostoc sp. TaxID=1180 RepID=UPI002FF8A886
MNAALSLINLLIALDTTRDSGSNPRVSATVPGVAHAEEARSQFQLRFIRRFHRRHALTVE